MSSLFVVLPAPAADAPAAAGLGGEFAWVLSPDGRHVASQGSAPAALLPAPSGAGAQVIGIVPAAALSWHRAELPKGVAAASGRLRAVIEGVLEDQLLDDPQALHFALQPQARGGAAAWVAACDRDWLRGCVQTLEAAGRPLARLVPEIAPEAPARLNVVGEPEAATVLASSEAGVYAAPLSHGTLGLLPELTADTLCLSEPAVAAQAEQVLQRPVVLQPAAQRWLQAAQSAWDLAQFEFASSGRARAAKRVAATVGDLLHAPQWRPARWGAALLVLANLVGLNAWAWKERGSLAAKESAVRTTLTTTFPNVRAVVDAPVQMEREVAALRQATGAQSPRDLEAMLGALAAAAPDRDIAGIEYTGGELRVRGLRWTEEDIRRTEPALRSHGLTARLQGDGVVLVTGAGS